jgi:hypothetical protein
VRAPRLSCISELHWQRAGQAPAGPPNRSPHGADRHGMLSPYQAGSGSMDQLILGRLPLRVFSIGKYAFQKSPYQRGRRGRGRGSSRGGRGSGAAAARGRGVAPAGRGRGAATAPRRA